MGSTEMGTMVRLHANRILRRRVLSSGERRGVPGFFSFAHNERPKWWEATEVRPRGEVIGVLEVSPGSSDKAVVITTEEILSLARPPVRVSYNDIARFEPLSKDPPSDVLVIRLRSGGTSRLALPTRIGIVSALLRFGTCAVREARKARGERVPG